jgi:predicted cupin superfamily sugar epimerase
MDLAAGQTPIVAVPGGCWKALRLHDGVSYALMANTLSPEFTPDRVKIGAGTDWVKRYAGSASWATPKALRELIGPNWIQK